MITIILIDGDMRETGHRCVQCPMSVWTVISGHCGQLNNNNKYNYYELHLEHSLVTMMLLMIMKSIYSCLIRYHKKAQQQIIFNLQNNYYVFFKHNISILSLNNNEIQNIKIIETKKENINK